MSTLSQPAPADARPLGSYKYYDLLLSVFIVALLISNLVGQKFCQIGPWVVSGANLLFPITYVFGDIFTEVYGYAGSRKAIWLGFFSNGLLAIMSVVVVALPPDPAWKGQEHFEYVFGIIPRLVIGSLVAYWCGEFANSYTLAKMKLWTKGKMLWTRTVGSTVVGQFVDTAVLYTVAFSFTNPWSTLAKWFAFGYTFKVAWEVLATPLTYLVVGFLKRQEGLDTFDYKTNFSPFHLRADSAGADRIS
jgi:uncharacterized integral membrane protein (TIGR00697 family)